MEYANDETLKLNIGGVVFETKRLTLQNDSNWKLSDPQHLHEHYRKATEDYYFDKDPTIFAAILNYLRSGKLHCPLNACGPFIKEELEFWRIDSNKIQRCCWTNFNDWNSTLEALEKLERDRKRDVLAPLRNPTRDTGIGNGETFWKRIRPRGWRFLNRNNSSIPAKIFGITALMIVILSVTSFILATTEPFKYYTYGARDIPPTNISFTNTNLTSAENSTTNETNNVKYDVTKCPCRSMENTTETTTLLGMIKTQTKHPVLNIIDIACLVYFTIEYIVRLIFAPRKLRYIKSFLAVIDLLAILPDYIEFIIYGARPDLRSNITFVSYVTVIRVLRVLRIFRLVRHSPGLWLLIYTLRASFRELMLLIWFMALGVLFYSSLIYYVDDRAVFTSIPTAFWWALITMTTVGYGDMYPHTSGGKVIGSCCAMTGVLVIGFTVPALVNNFMMYYNQMQSVGTFERREKQVEKMIHEMEDEDGNNVEMVPLTSKS